MIESIAASALANSLKAVSELAPQVVSELGAHSAEMQAAEALNAKMCQLEAADSSALEGKEHVPAKTEFEAEANLKEKMAVEAEGSSMSKSWEQSGRTVGFQELTPRQSWEDCYSGTLENGKCVFELRSGVDSKLLNQFPPPSNSVENVLTSSGNTMSFYHDEICRCSCVEIGKIERVDGVRDVSQQSICRELKNGLPTDDAGHVLAREFGGPPEQVNYLPMDSYTNRHGEWRYMERELEHALDAGKEVTHFRVEPQYDGLSRRPDGFEVSYQVDGATEYRYIDNTPTTR